MLHKLEFTWKSPNNTSSLHLQVPREKRSSLNEIYIFQVRNLQKICMEIGIEVVHDRIM
jgi:hypothetical protein